MHYDEEVVTTDSMDVAAKRGFPSDFFHNGLAIEFRTAAGDDFSFAWNVYWTFMQELAAPDTLANQRALLEESFFNNQAVIILVDGLDAGWMEIEETDDAFHLHQIHFLHELQGLGIGSAIIRQLIAAARWKAKPVKLEVLKSNSDAYRLYQRLGFGVDAADEQKFYMVRKDDGM